MKNNNNEIRLKIGEFSKLCRVTVKTLRHYERIGLLIPNEVDEWTGYRYYNVAQTLKMATIQHLKHLGLSLDEVMEVFANGADRPDLPTIQRKLHECEQQIKQLEHRAVELSALSEQLTSKNIMEKFVVKTIPACIVASHREVVENYGQLFNLCPNVIGPEMMRVGCTCSEPGYCYTIEHGAEHQENNIDVEYCEAVNEWHDDTPLLHFYEAPELKDAVCMKHFGSYSRFGESFAELLQYLQNQGKRIVGSPRFCYIDGIWNKETEDEWLTEIQVPVE